MQTLNDSPFEMFIVENRVCSCLHPPFSITNEQPNTQLTAQVSFETLVQADCVGVVAHVPRHKPDYAYSRESKSKKDSNNGGSVTLLAAEAIQVCNFTCTDACSCVLLF